METDHLDEIQFFPQGFYWTYYFVFSFISRIDFSAGSIDLKNDHGSVCRHNRRPDSKISGKSAEKSTLCQSRSLQRILLLFTLFVPMLLFLLVFPVNLPNAVHVSKNQSIFAGAKFWFSIDLLFLMYKFLWSGGFKVLIATRIFPGMNPDYQKPLHLSSIHWKCFLNGTKTILVPWLL